MNISDSLYYNLPKYIKDFLSIDISLVPFREYDKWGYSDRNGNFLIEAKYDRVEFFSEGYAFVENRHSFTSSYYLIDRLGNQLFDIAFNKVSYFNNGFTVVQPHSKEEIWIINHEKVIAKLKGNDFESYFGNFFILDKEGKQLIINTQDLNTESSKYEEILRIHINLFLVRREDKWNLIDGSNHKLNSFCLDNDYIADSTAESITVIENKLFKFKSNNKYGALNSAGEVILPFFYTGITKYDDNYAILQLEDKYSIIDSAGNFRSGFKFDKILSSDFKYALVKIGNNFEIYNFETNELEQIPPFQIGDLINGLLLYEHANSWIAFDINLKKEVFKWDKSLFVDISQARYKVLEDKIIHTVNGRVAIFNLKSGCSNLLAYSNLLCLNENIFLYERRLGRDVKFQGLINLDTNLSVEFDYDFLDDIDPDYHFHLNYNYNSELALIECTFDLYEESLIGYINLDLNQLYKGYPGVIDQMRKKIFDELYPYEEEKSENPWNDVFGEGEESDDAYWNTH